MKYVQVWVTSLGHWCGSPSRVKAKKILFKSQVTKLMTWVWLDSQQCDSSPHPCCWIPGAKLSVPADGLHLNLRTTFCKQTICSYAVKHRQAKTDLHRGNETSKNKGPDFWAWLEINSDLILKPNTHAVPDSPEHTHTLPSMQHWKSTSHGLSCLQALISMCRCKC